MAFSGCDSSVKLCFAPAMVPFINSDQKPEEEKMMKGCFQITKRNFILKAHFQPWCKHLGIGCC